MSNAWAFQRPDQANQYGKRVLLRTLQTGGLCFAALLASGCSREDKALHHDMRLLVLGYHNLMNTDDGPPKNVEELQRAFKAEAACMQRVRDGQIVVRWGLKIPDDFPSGVSNTVLMYEKDVPTKGGSVAMGDGFVRTMTADEFEASPLPEPKPRPGKKGRE